MTATLVVLLARIREAGALRILMLALAAVMAQAGNGVDCLLGRPHQVAVLVCGDFGGPALLRNHVRGWGKEDPAFASKSVPKTCRRWPAGDPAFSRAPEALQERSEPNHFELPGHCRSAKPV